MSVLPEQRSDNGEGIAPGVLTEADRALLLAMRAWAQGCRRPKGAGLEGEHDFIVRFWDWLAPGWVGRLCDAWDRGQKAGDGIAAVRALERLREMHVATIEASVSHVHPSWMVRALREESPAVQRLVAASVSGPLRLALQAGLLLDAQDITPDHAVQPLVREWVMGLWAERLVGGEASRRDDSPALVAVCGLSNRAGYRLCRVTGLGKMVVAGVKPSEKAADRIPVRSRVEWLEGRLGRSEPEFRAAALADVQSMARSKLPGRRHAARIGLLTLARLLADQEPFRLRWALQHWPYPIVKLIRTLMSSPAKPTPAMLAGEMELLKTAWERLKLEGRQDEEWPEAVGVRDIESGSP